ncbi:MAG: glycosyltransferase [Spirochaetales bacterium]
MRVLIVSYYFPPYMNVGGFRAMSWARRFFDRGHDVTVICGDGQEAESCSFFYESLDRDLRTLKIHNPLLEAAPASGSCAPEAGLADKLKTMLRPYLPMVDSYVLWSRAAVAAALEETRKEGRFDAVISTSFPLSAHEVARKVKKATGCVWAADFRDFYGQFASNELADSPRSRFLARRFRAYGREADVVLTVSKKLKKLVDKALGIDAPEQIADTTRSAHDDSGEGAVVLYNGYFAEHLPPIPPAPFAPQQWRILYTGSYNDNEFTVEPLAKALSAWPPEAGEKPEICFTGSPIESVEKAFREVGAALRFLGPIDNREALRLQAESAFLLICDSMSGPGALLTKTFEYLAVRRPIIGISRPGSELRGNLFAVEAAGYCLSMDPGEILSFMLRWREAFCGGGIHGAFYADEIISRYSREFQADLLVDRLEALLKSRQKGGVE